MLVGKEALGGVPIVGQRAKTQLVSMRMRVPSLALLRELKIPCRSKLRCRSKILLGSGVVVAVA